MTTIISGSTGVTFPTGSNPQQAPSKVLQVVNTVLPPSTVTTTSTSFVTTGFSISITPLFSNSQILLLVNGGSAYASASNLSYYGTIYRGSTNLGDASFGLERVYTLGTNVIVPHSMAVLDSPASTSAQTYTCYFRSSSGVGVQFNLADGGNISFTAMEIAA